MSEMNTDKKPRELHRYSISVSGKTYDRLRSAVTSCSLASFVDGVVTSALDDPTIVARLLARCQVKVQP